MQKRNATVAFAPDTSIWKQTQNLTTWLQHSVDFRQNRIKIGYMLHHLIVDDKIELIGREWYLVIHHWLNDGYQALSLGVTGGGPVGDEGYLGVYDCQISQKFWKPANRNRGLK